MSTTAAPPIPPIHVRSGIQRTVFKELLVDVIDYGTDCIKHDTPTDEIEKLTAWIVSGSKALDALQSGSYEMEHEGRTTPIIVGPLDLARVRESLMLDVAGFCDENTCFGQDKTREEMREIIAKGRKLFDFWEAVDDAHEAYGDVEIEFSIEAS